MSWQVKTVGRVLSFRGWGTTYTRETVTSLASVPEVMQLHLTQILARALFDWQETDFQIRIESATQKELIQPQLPKNSSTLQSETGDSLTTPFGKATQP